MQTSPTLLNAAETTSRPIRKPDFFIIGAPKAGTTSLYTYLAAHRQIFMPRIKEPFFFCSDLPAYREKMSLITDTTKYLNLFEAAKDQHLACGEASVFYLFSEVAVRRILEFNPAARFIVMLRNPIDLLYSFHSQLVYSLHESVVDFEYAWRLQDVRAQGRNIPNGSLEPALLQYRRVGMLGAQMQRLLSCVSRERVKVVLLEDMARDPRGVYEEVLAFLDVPSDHRSEFTRENTNKSYRSRWLAELIRTPPYPLDLLRNEYRRRFGIRTWPAMILARLNGKRASRPRLCPALRRELEDVFRDDVRLLEQLIGRDLTHWISVASSPRPLCKANGTSTGHVAQSTKH